MTNLTATLGSEAISIGEASLQNIDELSILFDLYRQFYRQPSNVEDGKRFLNERIQNKDSKIYVALMSDGKISGFVQLYPLFTSVGMKRLWILNDLYVKEEYRKKGVARSLIDHCKKLAHVTQAAGLMLETGKNNLEGNVLYPTEGFKLIDESNFYFWKK